MKKLYILVLIGVGFLLNISYTAKIRSDLQKQIKNIIDKQTTVYVVFNNSWVVGGDSLKVPMIQIDVPEGKEKEAEIIINGNTFSSGVISDPEVKKAIYDAIERNESHNKLFNR